MKKASTMIALLGLFVTMAVAANAQMASRNGLRATVPFAFKVGGKTLPAGEYQIAQINPWSDRAILQIKSQDGSLSAVIQMNWVKGKTATGSMLVFHRYGDSYFLAQAWIDGESEGLAAPRSHAERLMQKELAAMKSQTETVRLRTR